MIKYKIFQEVKSGVSVWKKDAWRTKIYITENVFHSCLYFYVTRCCSKFKLFFLPQLSTPICDTD